MRGIFILLAIIFSMSALAQQLEPSAIPYLQGQRNASMDALAAAAAQIDQLTAENKRLKAECGPKP